MEKMWIEEQLTNKELDFVDNVERDRNLAGTKGFVIGALVVGAGWLGTYLYKRYKDRKVERAVEEIVEELDGRA